MCKKLDNEITKANAENGVRTILNVFDDSTREGLEETPKRYIKFLNEFLTPEPFNFTTFEGDGYDEMILVKNIPFFSLCEHHLAPFFGTGAIAYIPNQKTGRIVGLSKLPRVLDLFARKLQNQERITSQVADYIQEQLGAEGVAVMLEARHLCVEMRGIKKHDVTTTTTKLTGSFKNEAAVRAEFYAMVRK